MIIRKVSNENLQDALDRLNKKYDNNICWNNFQIVSSHTYRVTLKCKDSSKAGHRLGFTLTSKGNRRRLSSACWHVHGDFFDILLDINPNIVIKAGLKTIDVNGGNWEDWNIGSMMSPLMFSEACECGY